MTAEAILDRVLARVTLMARREGRRWPTLRDEFASTANWVAWLALRDGRGDPEHYAAWKARRAFMTLVKAHGQDRCEALDIDPEGPFDGFETIDCADAFDAILRRAGPPYAPLLRRVYADGLTVAEAARERGIAIQTAHNHLAIAFAAIRAALLPEPTLP